MSTRVQIPIGHSSSVLKQAHQRWLKGIEQGKAGQWASAATSFEQAVRAVPRDTLYRLNLVRALSKSGRSDEAIGHAHQILKVEPQNLLARQYLGECLSKQGRHSEAADVLDALPTDLPRNAEYLQVQANNLFESQRYVDAIGVTMQALALQVDHAQSHYQLGLCFHALGMKHETMECLETAAALNIEGGLLACHSLLAFLSRELCDWRRAQPEILQMNAMLDALQPGQAAWMSVFASVTLTDDVDRHLKAARTASLFFGRGAQPMPLVAPRPMPRQLRIGMVSADFHQHATTILMAELIEKLDRERFSVHLYSHGPDDKSAMRERIKRAGDSFLEIGGMSDKEAAQRVRDDGIDILIDLKGHTSRCRMGIFAWRPAPIQVGYLGFPGTSGADYLDYMVGDPVVTPLDQAPWYTEKLAQMPICYQPNDRQRALPQLTSRAAHGLPEDALVLCGFNQPFKISPEMMDIWCGLLQRWPHAVLWLLKWNVECESALIEQARQRGIDASRLVFAPAISSAQHISRFALADIFVDTWPCNGHTTASDALWAGVPVVTCSGQSFASRVAGSLLNAVGLGEWVSTDLAGYEARITRLAEDPELRRSIRAQLVQARDASPLFDSDRYASDFGELMWRMAERQSAGLPPQHLPAVS